jgi:hypothetical protein
MQRGSIWGKMQAVSASLQSAGVGEYIAVRMMDHVPGRYWSTKSARDITRYIFTRWVAGDFDSLLCTFSGTV